MSVRQAGDVGAQAQAMFCGATVAFLASVRLIADQDIQKQRLFSGLREIFVTVFYGAVLTFHTLSRGIGAQESKGAPRPLTAG